MQHFINPEKFEKLKISARYLNAYYFSPVYLVGSSLLTENHIDVDIFIVLTNEYFEYRYGQESVKNFISGFLGGYGVINNNWLRDREKKWVKMSNDTGLNIDLRIVPQSAFPIDNRKRLRIDNI